MADTDVFVEIEKVTKSAMRQPSRFNVVLYNDNVTTIEFVMEILMSIFHKSFDESSDLCMHIHENGKGIAGTYGLEVATQKREETILAARVHGFPLRCDCEEAQKKTKIVR